MKARMSIALAVALVLSDVTAASAAHWWHSLSRSTMARPAGDKLSLNKTQQKTAWNDLNTAASKEDLPSGFNASIGSVVPSTFKIEPVPSRAANDIPALRPYDFAVVHGKLLIVNPSDKKISDVITG
jgi:hypothetical protein